jgi:hypothetical protein
LDIQTYRLKSQEVLTSIHRNATNTSPARQARAHCQRTLQLFQGTRYTVIRLICANTMPHAPIAMRRCYRR